ncbi:Protein of unknown function DUF2232, membrane [Thiorhodococcus drewsii AZ1]|uniref:DUF2232 domain-containing protein n=2 Tax=Thiorhodococcus drewsii TaxID=210408 RepID=G2E4Z1_9GAMM|nr:Protein of unknown function DUF2232, membrane [Thiorhodococcus drewsii AZ1]
MKALAHFVMRGYSQAALVAAVSALLSMLMPLLGLISSASVGLVTLRNGARAGILLMLLSTLGAGVFAWLALGSLWPALGVLLVFWLPVWALAVVLRLGRSLDLTVQLAGLGGLLLVIALFTLVGDPTDYWHQLLEPVRQSLLKDGLVEADSSQAMFAEIERWMTGAFAAGLVLQSLVGLFLARWWQAVLFNPGGFGQEFRALGVGRVVGGLFLVLLGWVLMGAGAGAAAGLLPVSGVLLLLQGLAVAHGVRHIRNAPRGWLIGLYVLMVFMPQMGLLVACLGLVDVWLDIRGRMARRTSKSG